MNKLLNKKALKIKLDNRSKYLRQLIVKALIGGGRGHMGAAMSLVEILRILYDEFIKFDPKQPKNENRDRLILINSSYNTLSISTKDIAEPICPRPPPISA